MYVGRENGLVTAKCPYFERNSEKSITCEGLIEGSNVKMEFKTEDRKDEFLRENCKKYPDCQCAVRTALDRKYGIR